MKLRKINAAYLARGPFLERMKIDLLGPDFCFFHYLLGKVSFSSIFKLSITMDTYTIHLLCVFASQVCELDIIFNFEKAYFILDEFLLGGEVQETSKKNVLKAIEQADLLQEVCVQHALDREQHW